MARMYVRICDCLYYVKVLYVMMQWNMDRR